MGKRGLLTCLLALVLGAAAAAEPGVLRVGTSGDYAPFSVAGATPDGYDGFDVAVARAYAEERGLELRLVPFKWSSLTDDLAADAFDVAMSGVTVRPDRSLAGRFSIPVAQSGAVALVPDDGRFDSIEALDRRGVRIGVNGGGHLERVAQERFQRATVVSVPENDAVIAALESMSVDAVVSDTLEAPVWRARRGDLAQLGPFTRDRKAYLVQPTKAELAADLDTWLLAREADGSLGKLRRRHLGADAAPTATPLDALVATLDERLALMPAVEAAKRRASRPIRDPAREKVVLQAGVAAVRDAAARAGVEPLPEAVAEGFFRAQIDAAVAAQLAAGRAPGGADATLGPDLAGALRPALLRIGEKIAVLLVRLPSHLDIRSANAAVTDGVRSPWLTADSRRALAQALVAVSQSRGRAGSKGKAAGVGARAGPKPGAAEPAAR
jgi:cyclohexadienyl dehydratase